MVRHLPETLWCSAKHYGLRQRDRPTAPASEDAFAALLDAYDEDEAFVHVGLSDVSAAFDGNPYEFVLDRLDARFDSILTPGFTQSFRDSGYFHRGETEPELGAFAGLFFETADYRTADPLHSIQVLGDYRFEDCTHRDTFGPEGCYAKLDADDVRILDIGTRWLVSTQIHYVERRTDVPYVDRVEIEGTVHHGDGEREHVTQTTYDKNKYVYYWDRVGIMRDLLADGVLDHYDLNGLTVVSVSARDLRTALESRIAEDPYYLVR